MQITPELLKKYSNGDCSSVEIKVIEGWLNSEEQENTSENFVTTNDIELRIWNQIKETKKEFPRERNHKLTNYKMWAVAASVILLIGITPYFYFFNNTITYQTSIGELKTIELEDGTTITLNVASTLKLDKDFNTTHRTVTLNGEAFFKVAKDSLHPFVITTQKTVTKVLGTQFNLSAYKNETNIVTLNEGKVLFYQKGLSEEYGAILKPNEQVFLQNNILTKNNVHSEKYNAWMLHKFIFMDEPLQSITSKMERTYGVNIRIENPKLKNELFRGTYKNPSLNSLLEDLSFVLKFKYKKEGKNIIIY